MSASVTIEIPMVPDKCLNVNARCHWSQVRACAKRLRETAGWAALAVMREHLEEAGWPVSDAVVMDLDVRWPVGARIKDSDNCWSMFKAGRDGIADVLFNGDDSHIRLGTLTQAVTGEGITVVTVRAERPLV